MNDAKTLLTIKDALGQAGIDGAGRFNHGLVAGALDQVPQSGSLMLTGSILRSVAVAAHVQRTTSQAIPNATVTYINFDQVNDDPYSMFSAGATDRLTAYAAGLYLVTGQVTWENNASGVRYLEFELNGAAVITSTMIAAIASSWPVCISTLYNLSEGDFIRLRVYQTSGGNLNVLPAHTIRFALSRQA